jgi:hypothetical protein
MSEAARNHVTVGMVVEQALWKALGQVAARKGARLHERLQHANALISQIVAYASPMMVVAAGDFEIPGQTTPPPPVPVDVHEVEARRRRRNQISQKAMAAFEEVYDLAQTEALASQNQARAAMYLILARLAEVNEASLRNASDEEVMDEIQRLREEQERFEEATRSLEKEAKEAAATK